MSDSETLVLECRSCKDTIAIASDAFATTCKCGDLFVDVTDNDLEVYTAKGVLPIFYYQIKGKENAISKKMG